MKKVSSNIRSPEMMANISWSQLRLAPAVRHTLYTRALTSITITLWLLALTTAASGIEKSKWAIGNAYLIGVFLCLGGLSLLNSVRLWRGCITTPVFSKYTRLVFTALLLWCAVTIVRVDWFDKWELKQVFGTRFFGWAWIVPVSMVLGSDIGMWRRALRVVVSLGALGCIIFIFGWTLQFLHGDFGFTQMCPIALIFCHYFSKQTRRILLLGVFITLFMSILASSRNLIFAQGLLILFASYIQFFRRDIWRLRTRVYLMLGCSIAFIVIACVASIDHIPFVGDTINTGVNKFKGEFMNNSRGIGESNSLFAQFNKDVHGLDLVIGRGCRGSYDFKSGKTDGPFRGYKRKYYERNYIECGYYQIILHGGVVIIVLILALAIPAIYLGMFRSRNWFTRGCAFIVLGRLLEMVPFGLPVANVRYVLFWMAIGACLTWKIRAMSDADIVKIFAARSAIGAGNER